MKYGFVVNDDDQGLTEIFTWKGHDDGKQKSSIGEESGGCTLDNEMVILLGFRLFALAME